jgi:hypothetical protein
VGFVRERIPAQPAADEAPAAAAGHAPAAAALPEAPAAFPRRVPVSVLRPPLGSCVPTGVVLGEGSRVIVMPDSGGVAAALQKRLEKLGVEVLLVEGAPSQEDLERRVGEWTSAAPVQGVYWLPALDAEAGLPELDPETWREGLRVRVKLLAATMRALPSSRPGRHVPRLGQPPRRPARLRRRRRDVVMGGRRHRLHEGARRERPDALSRRSTSRPAADGRLADVLVEETLRDPGAVEIGHADGLRWSVGLVERPAPTTPRELAAETSFLVTGAAGSIVSAITADLAAASGATFHLLDLVPRAGRRRRGPRALRTDRDGLKRDIADRMRARGERPTPGSWSASSPVWSAPAPAWTRSRRFSAPGVPRTGTRST